MSRRSHSRSRTPRPVAHHLQKSKSPKLKRKKPEWDNSIHDLSVYKATEDDLWRRKLSHQSTNFDLVREDNLQKRVIQARKKSNVHNGIIKEILISEKELGDVLGKSDDVISMARNILKQEAMKHVSCPAITRPTAQVDECNLLPDVEKAENRESSDSSRPVEYASSARREKLRLLNDLKRMQLLLTESLKEDFSAPKASKVNYLNDYSDCEDNDSTQSALSSMSHLPKLKKIVDDLTTDLRGKPSDENPRLLEVVCSMVEHFENVIDKLKIETSKREEAEKEIERMNEKMVALEAEVSLLKEETNCMKKMFEDCMKENIQIIAKLKSSTNIASPYHRVEVSNQLDVAGSNLLDQHRIIPLQPYMQSDSPTIAVDIPGQEGAVSSHSSKSILRNSNRINRNQTNVPRTEVKNQLENLNRQQAEALRMLNELTLLEQRKSSSARSGNFKKSTSVYPDTDLHER